MQVQNKIWESEVEKALDAYIKTKDMNVCLNIYNLCAPVISKAFNKSFKDPFMLKKRGYEVQTLKDDFGQESFLKVVEVLGEITNNVSPGSVDLKALRGRLTGRLYMRAKSDVYKKVVDHELSGYPINISKEEKELHSAEKQFEEGNGRKATVQELAELMNHRPGTVRNYMQIRDCRRVVSLDMDNSDDPNDNTTFGDWVPSSKAEYQPEHAVNKVFSAEIDRIMKSKLTDREYRRVRMRSENAGMSEMDMAKMELGEDADPKKLSACQRSINRDLNSAYKKLADALAKYKED